MHVVMSACWRRHGRLVCVLSPMPIHGSSLYKIHQRIVIEVVALMDVVVNRNNNNNNKSMTRNNGFENMVIDDSDFSIDPSFINIVVII